jgi:hypothetical protein
MTTTTPAVCYLIFAIIHGLNAVTLPVLQILSVLLILPGLRASGGALPGTPPSHLLSPRRVDEAMADGVAAAD